MASWPRATRAPRNSAKAVSVRAGPACQNICRTRSSVSGVIIMRWVAMAASLLIRVKNAWPMPSNWPRSGASLSVTNNSSGIISMHLAWIASLNKVSLSPKWL